ncbi:MAG: hypothetical protein A3E01_20490 [Gammaproteobacteria bacterium RIFCSPHIGHO2_12_FULL_63_22]|nr:MAG: hypothetical protein A3E01_20490 [Gammaproteobacteria bacterium RIFCSPHIGHO2_12_FULL_63_22]
MGAMETLNRTGRALCLSGGGYRAALFHLGALLRLHATGRLHGVDTISAVSGGSIASAWLATRYLRGRRDESEGFADWCERIDFKADVVEPFRAVARQDLRSAPVLLTVAWNWLWPSARVNLLQARYEKIFEGVELRDLPASPAFVFCATNLTFGVNWEFSRRRCGDFQTGYLRRHGRISLATAVAASACFPPLFGPLRLPFKAEDFSGGSHRSTYGDHLRDRVELSDGGVYDNLGTEPVIKSCREMLVSDAGAPFAFVAGEHVFRRLLRYASVVGNQAAALRKRLFFGGLRSGDFEGAYWNLADRSDAGAEGYSLGLCEEVISRIRTDLDKFTAAEFEVLVNHGYFSCVDGMETDPSGLAPLDWPYPDRSGEDAVRIALRQSHRRFFHARWWQN